MDKDKYKVGKGLDGERKADRAKGRGSKSRSPKEVGAGKQAGGSDGFKYLSLFDENARKDGKVTLKQTMVVSRELVRQQTRVRKQGQDLFSILNEKAREDAIQVHENGGGVLSQIVDGIDGGETVSKVILGLAHTLYEQSEMSGTLGSMMGATDKILPYLEMSLPKIKKSSGRSKALDGSLVSSPCPCVCIRMADFTRLVLGTNEKPSNKDKDRVREALESISKKMVYLAIGDGRYIGRTLIGKRTKLIDTKKGSEVWLLELDSVFTCNILNDFAVLRKDTLMKLKGRQMKITMRLLYYLIEKRSYDPDNLNHRVSKIDLFNRIAIISKYEKNPKERDRDFKEALQKMVDVHLIDPIKLDGTNYAKDSGYHEEIGSDGYTPISCFRFNKNYTTDEG